MRKLIFEKNIVVFQFFIRQYNIDMKKIKYLISYNNTVLFI